MYQGYRVDMTSSEAIDQTFEGSLCGLCTYVQEEAQNNSEPVSINQSDKLLIYNGQAQAKLTAHCPSLLTSILSKAEAYPTRTIKPEDPPPRSC